MTTCRDREIADLRSQGIMNLSEIARKYGLSRERVRQICGEMGVDIAESTALYARNRATWKEKTRQDVSEDLESMYARGEYYGEICKALAMTYAQVAEAVSKIDNDFIHATRRDALAKKRSESAARVAMGTANRKWSKENIVEALVGYVRDKDGELPPNVQYQLDSVGNVYLPSSATIRNTIGKWSDVRRIVRKAHQEVSNGNGN